MQITQLRAIALASRHIWLHEVHVGFPQFWEEIGAEGDQRRALREFEVRYNAS